MKSLEEIHTENPKVGDYWEEMFCPICVVVAVLPNSKVVICRSTKSVDIHHWTWDLDKLEVMSTEEMRKMLKYSTIDAYVADVHPERHKWVAEV